MRFNKQTAPFELRVKWRHFQKFRECQSDFADEIVTNKRENIKPNIFQSSVISHHHHHRKEEEEEQIFPITSVRPSTTCTQTTKGEKKGMSTRRENVIQLVTKAN